MPNEKFFEFEEIAEHFKPPVLVVSSVVGRGVFSVGEAIQQKLARRYEVHHEAIEELVPDGAVEEDLRRYKLISNRAPWLLYLIYKVPIFYYRKYAREWFRNADLPRLRQMIETHNIRTVICASHRPAFWVSTLKRRSRLPIDIWGVGIELGRNLGWQYLFWDQMQGLLSPVSRQQTGIRLPAHVQFYSVELPVRNGYKELAQTPGDPNSVTLVCGAWGQGPLVSMVRILTESRPELKIDVVCGDNQKAYAEICQSFAGKPHLKAHPTVPSLYPFLQACGSVITKPGIATLLECYAAGRKIFLLKGMPVAEDNNARFAIEHMNAEWFTPERFDQWRSNAMTKWPDSRQPQKRMEA